MKKTSRAHTSRALTLWIAAGAAVLMAALNFGAAYYTAGIRSIHEEEAQNALSLMRHEKTAGFEFAEDPLFDPSLSAPSPVYEFIAAHVGEGRGWSLFGLRLPSVFLKALLCLVPLLLIPALTPLGAAAFGLVVLASPFMWFYLGGFAGPAAFFVFFMLVACVGLIGVISRYNLFSLIVFGVGGLGLALTDIRGAVIFALSLLFVAVLYMLFSRRVRSDCGARIVSRAWPFAFVAAFFIFLFIFVGSRFFNDPAALVRLLRSAMDFGGRPGAGETYPPWMYGFWLIRYEIPLFVLIVISALPMVRHRQSVFMLAVGVVQLVLYSLALPVAPALLCAMMIPILMAPVISFKEARLNGMARAFLTGWVGIAVLYLTVMSLQWTQYGALKHAPFSDSQTHARFRIISDVVGGLSRVPQASNALGLVWTDREAYPIRYHFRLFQYFRYTTETSFLAFSEMTRYQILILSAGHARAFDERFSLLYPEAAPLFYNRFVLPYDMAGTGMVMYIRSDLWIFVPVEVKAALARMAVAF